MPEEKVISNLPTLQLSDHPKKQTKQQYDVMFKRQMVDQIPELSPSSFSQIVGLVYHLFLPHA